MTKKILCSVALIFVFVFAFAGCKHEHEWAEATCTEPKTCSTCGETEGVAKEHQWTEATCTEPKTCSLCGDTEGSKKGHVPGEWIIDTDAACTEDGKKHKICSVCNEIVDERTILAYGHSFGGWIVDTAPTCTEDGKEKRLCAYCGEIGATRTVEELGHTDGEWVVDTAPTCNEEGRRHQECSVCEATLKTEVLSASGHDYETSVVRKATETVKALIEYECTVCNYAYSEEAEPLTVSVGFEGTGLIFGQQMYYTRSFYVYVSGGFGICEYEVADDSTDNVIIDYQQLDSISAYFTVQGNMFIDNAFIRVTVRDEAGQKCVYVVRGNGDFVETYTVYE